MNVEILDPKLGTPMRLEREPGEAGDWFLLLSVVVWIITVTQVALPIAFGVWP